MLLLVEMLIGGFNMSFQVRLGTTSAIATNGSGTEGTTMITFPISSTYKTTSSTLVSNGRNSKGVLKINVIRAGVRKIELSWRVISISDYAKLGTFFNNNFTFYAYYFDQDTNAWVCKEMYVGDRVADSLTSKNWITSVRGGLVEPEYVENLKLSLIEV